VRTIPAPVPDIDVDFEELSDHSSFQSRYKPDGDDNWLSEVDDLKPEDLDRLDPAMLEEADRRAYRLAVESKLVQEARQDLFVYMSLRYGYRCPRPQKVIYPHQSLVVDDLMRLEQPDTLKSYFLTAPRGFVKTSTVSDWLEWYLGRHPFLKTMIVGATERISVKRLSVIKKNVILDPLFRAVFPEVRLDQDRPNNMTNVCLTLPEGFRLIDTRSSTIEAYGVGSSPEGGRADALLFDDVCTYENSVVETKQRESIKEKLRVTWYPLRTGPNTLRVWTCTPWHDQDASMEIYKKKHGWKKRYIRVAHDFSCLEDVTSGEEMPLPAERWSPEFERFEEWWSKERLKDLWRDDPEEFRVAYRLETVSHESDLANWASSWLWGDPSREVEGAVQFGFKPVHALYRCSLIAIGVDLAYGVSGASKNTAVVVVGIREDGKRVVLDANYGRGWGTTRKVEEIEQLYRRWSADIIVVEDNAAQKMLVDLLTDKREFDVRVEAFTTDMYKEAKLKSLSNEYEDNWWIIPFEDETVHGQGQGCKCGRCLLIKEMENYPDFNTSDVLMGSLFAKEGLKMLGADRSGPIYRTISA